MEEVSKEVTTTIRNKNSFNQRLNIMRIKSLKSSLKKKILNYLNSLKITNSKTEFMETPCKHKFHSVCMEEWMKQKHECPYCRTKIPSLE